MRRRGAAVVALLTLAASPIAAAAAAPLVAPLAVTDLGALEPGGSAGPVAVNAAGQVAGTASLAQHLHAFLADGTTMADLAPLPGMTESGASDLNDRGLVAGWSTSANVVDSRAVVWDRGVAGDVGDLGGEWSLALGLNDTGVVVGSATTPSGARHGFRAASGEVVDLNDVLPLAPGEVIEDGTRVDDEGRIIGRVHLATGEVVGYLYDGAAVHHVRLQPGDFTNVAAFSAAGVVGTSNDGSSISRAFLWRDGSAVALPPIPGDACTDARDVDARGRAVGTSAGCGRGSTRAVLWQDGRAVDLQALIPADGRWRLRNAMSIADDGRIAAIALDADGASHAVLLTPTGAVGVLSGADGVATAVAAAATAVPNELSTVVLAGVASPADAAVAAAHAARHQSALLLTSRDHLDAAVEAALAQHLHPGGTVEIVGGTAAVGAAVEARARSLGYAVVRRAGIDRSTTATRVAEADGAPGAVVLVSSEAIDAAAAVPVAVHERAALLYTASSALLPATRAYLDARPGWPRIGIGRAAATEGVTTPIAGADRVATSIAVAERFFADPASAVRAPSSSAIAGAVAARVASSAAGPVLLVAGEDDSVTRFLATRPSLVGTWSVQIGSAQA